MELYINNSSVLTLSGLRNVRTDEVVADATVRLTLYDPDGDEVTGQSWPVTLTAEGNGQYYAILAPSIDIDQGTTYNARVTANTGTAQGEWNCPLYATRRNCT
jgi:hypothetical protein